MLSPEEISDGANRLLTNKLRPSDQHSLFVGCHRYLKNIADRFPDLETRLAAVTDADNEFRKAAKLAAILISLEESGYSRSEMRGGRSALYTNKQAEFAGKLQDVLIILGYIVPEEFNGGSSGGNSGDSMSGAPFDIAIW